MYYGTGKKKKIYIYIYPIKYLNRPLLPYDSIITLKKHYSSKIYFINTNCFFYFYERNFY